MSSSILLLLFLLICGNAYVLFAVKALRIRNKHILLILIGALPIAYIPLLMNWSGVLERHILFGFGADEFIAYALSFVCISGFHFFVRFIIADGRVSMRRLNLAVYCFAATVIILSAALKHGVFDSLLLNDVFMTLLHWIPATLVAVYLIYLAVILRFAMLLRKDVHD